MREIIARRVCLFTIGVVVALSLIFASEHNRPVQANVADSTLLVPAIPAAVPGETISNAASKSVPPAKAPSTEEVERGRAVYDAQKCATCHSIAGEGNPRNPLDGVASRWDASELRDWITGTGVAAEVLSAAVVSRKQRYQSIPAAELNGLVAYLSGLVADGKATSKDGTKEITR